MWVICWDLGWWERWKCAGENLEVEVVLVANPVAAALDDADLVVQSFDKPNATLFSGRQ